MCGRYTITGPLERYIEHFGVEEVRTDSLEPSYNVAPTESVYGLAEHDRRRQIGRFRWGLLPFWARDPRSIQINARAETITEKAVFRKSFTQRRCIIPADGFYEWERTAQGKLPHYIHLVDGRPMGFAGIWSRWRDPETGESVTTCAIVTTEPNELVGRLHDRMPAVLRPEHWSAWLDRSNRDPEGLLELLAPCPAKMMTAYPVASLVNKVQNNVPELIAPLPRPDADR
jgi:putative SOS response-associated peptidase YedK